MVRWWAGRTAARCAPRTKQKEKLVIEPEGKQDVRLVSTGENMTGIAPPDLTDEMPMLLGEGGQSEAGERDLVLMRGEREGWGRDKTSRRAVVSTTHEIVMLLGDNVGDFYAFDAEEPDNATRAASVVAGAARTAWGDRWFMLPNPMYGGWDEAAVGYDYGAGAERVRERRRSELDARR